MSRSAIPLDPPLKGEACAADEPPWASRRMAEAKGLPHRITECSGGLLYWRDGLDLVAPAGFGAWEVPSPPCQMTPNARMASATRTKPAILAPRT